MYLPRHFALSDHALASSAHCRWLTTGPPGPIPAASAAATYLRTVFRDSPRLAAISFFDLPACQCVKISQISITSNVLLGHRTPRLGDEGNHPCFPMTRSTPDTHVLTMVNNVIGVVNYVIAARASLLNFVIADIQSDEP
jgi:hypothetical protein